MTTATNPFGHICNYQTGNVIRPATEQEWRRTHDVGDAFTGAHLDTDGVTIVFCDGPDFLSPAVPTCPACGLDEGSPECLCESLQPA